MRTVLAALDASAAARPVLETARAMAELTAATVEAIHVRTGRDQTPEWLAAQHRTPLRMLDGEVEPSLLRAVSEPPVIAAVFGARSTPGGRRPAGHTAMRVLERATKPVVVVPPEAVAVPPRPIRRLLLPLEGSEASSRPVLECLYPLIAADVELVVLHVFTCETVPRVLDRAERDLPMWGDEFVARFCPPATRIELRTGPVGLRVSEMTAEEAVDLVVLSWSQDSSPGHAAVIRDVLGSTTIPVLLLPVDSAAVRTMTNSGPSSPG